MEFTFLRTLLDAAIAAADPRIVLAPALPRKPTGRCMVVGAGKAAAAMAQAVDRAWPDVALSGVVVTRHGHAVPAGRIDVLEAAHPVPDATSMVAAARILAAVRGLDAGDLVLFLVSGGGSAVMALPAPGVTLAEKQAVTRALLGCGATIAEINTVRRRLSAIKGGRLAAAVAPARLVTLAISDVPGDLPELIASGPTVADTSAADAAPALLARYGIDMSPAVAAAFARPAPILADADFRLIATPLLSLQAAAARAAQAGITPLILGDALEGEARETVRVLAGMALACKAHHKPARPPCVLLSGGETTVTIGAAPHGKGGRNTEFLAALALQLHGASGIWALAADTDGIDGTEDAAGARLAPHSLAAALARGLDARRMLDAHDSYSLFEALGDLIVTGPTLTNVNDFRAILIA